MNFVPEARGNKAYSDQTATERKKESKDYATYFKLLAKPILPEVFEDSSWRSSKDIIRQVVHIHKGVIFQVAAEDFGEEPAHKDSTGIATVQIFEYFWYENTDGLTREAEDAKARINPQEPIDDGSSDLS